MSVLDRLVGKKVTVHSVSADIERQDVGVLEALDDKFICLRKTDTELLFFVIQRVRLVKPFDPH